MRRRRLLRCGWLLLGAAPAAIASRALAQGRDDVAGVIDTLVRARSYKVRVQAIATLARLTDARAPVAVARAATSDVHPAVRGYALRTLGRNPWRRAESAREARAAIGRALNDRDAGVRRKAAAALGELDRGGVGGSAVAATGARAKGGPMLIAVGNIGDKTGRASRQVRELMRTTIQSLLSRDARVQVAGTSTPGLSFIIDGTIAKLDVAQSGADMEAVCAVQLVVSRPPRGIITIASGEAMVQKPRMQWKPHLRGPMEEEALANAVKSAHDSLASFLAAQ